VHLLALTWRDGSLLLLAIAGLTVLVAAMRTEPSRLTWSRRCWPWLLLLVMWTGDAALGDGRPLVERTCKGIFAVLVWLSLAVALWRRRRHRNEVESSAVTRNSE
jgi:hypothetical protein